MDRLIIFTGAGVSAESGLATFRDDRSGLWANHDLKEVCDIDTWQDNFRQVHAFYNQRRSEIQKAQPNAFHEAVARWSRDHEVINITQNIDDLFERAGCQDVIHLHGFCRDMVCVDCNHKWQIDGDWVVGDICPQCSQDRYVKPGIVFFGENAPHYLDLKRVVQSIEDGDIILVAGTSEKVVNISSMLYSWKGHNVKVDPNADRYSVLLIYHDIITKTATEAITDIDQIISR